MDITIQVTDDDKEFLTKKGYDEKYGARPLRRAIQSQVEDKLAEKISDRGIYSDDEVEITKVDEGLHSEVKALLKE